MRRAVRDRGLFDVKKNTNAKTHKVTHDKVHTVQFNTANGKKKVFPAQHNSALRKRRAEGSHQSGCKVGAKWVQRGRANKARSTDGMQLVG